MSMREFIEQRLHYALGWQMARSLRGIRGLTRAQKIAFVMDWVRAREDLQHPDKTRGPDGFHGPGSRYDEEWFRRGAEAGVGR